MERKGQVAADVKVRPVSRSYLMRLLIVSQYFWPENFRVNDLAEAFRDHGHEVVVLTGIPNYPSGSFFEGYGFFSPGREQWNGIEIVRMPLVPRGTGSGLRLALNFISFALFASLLAPFRCRGDFDAIFVHEPSPITVGFPAMVMRRLKRAPLFFWVLDLWPESLAAAGGIRSRKVLGLVDRMVRFIYRRCDKVLVQSRRFIEPISRQGVDRADILYFPSWAETLYRPERPALGLREELGFSDGFCVMFAGNVGASQDFESILASAEQLKSHRNIHWIIVGDGRMSLWVHQQVEKRGLADQVHILGRHPVERMPQFFAEADAMLVSLKPEPIFAMTIPGKVQSYLACGRPVIAMLDGEGAAVVEEAEAGFTCAAGNMIGLAEAVMRMAALNEAERIRMGENGRRYYEKHFERDMLFSKLEAWMRNAAAGTVIDPPSERGDRV